MQERHVKGVSRGLTNNKTAIITSYYSDVGVTSSKPNGTTIGTVEILDLTLSELNELIKLKYECFKHKGKKCQQRTRTEISHTVDSENKRYLLFRY